MPRVLLVASLVASQAIGCLVRPETERDLPPAKASPLEPGHGLTAVESPTEPEAPELQLIAYARRRRWAEYAQLLHALCEGAHLAHAAVWTRFRRAHGYERRLALAGLHRTARPCDEDEWFALLDRGGEDERAIARDALQRLGLQPASERLPTQCLALLPPLRRLECVGSSAVRIHAAEGEWATPAVESVLAAPQWLKRQIGRTLPVWRVAVFERFEEARPLLTAAGRDAEPYSPVNGTVLAGWVLVWRLGSKGEAGWRSHIELEALLRHEFVHLAIAHSLEPRAAPRLPRWFEEGVADALAMESGSGLDEHLQHMFRLRAGRRELPTWAELSEAGWSGREAGAAEELRFRYVAARELVLALWPPPVGPRLRTLLARVEAGAEPNTALTESLHQDPAKCYEALLAAARAAGR